jgi:hypothetical protein
MTQHGAVAWHWQLLG